MSGLLVALTATDGLIRELGRLEAEFKEECDCEWAIIRLKALIDIGYIDRLGEKSRASYDITPWSGWARPNVPLRLPFSLATAYQYRSEFPPAVILSSLTAKKIKENWESYPSLHDMKYFAEAPA
jgi:hypothetical protein